MSQTPIPYFNPSYDSEYRFISYWHQIHEITKLKPKKILEIGVGNGFVSKYLKQKLGGAHLTTLDIDERLHPDVIGSVTNIPFPNNSFDVISCCEVLEHLPYENFPKALLELYRATKSYVILSLPDASKVFRKKISIFKEGEIKIFIPLPRFKNPIHKFNREHYWEIGKSGYPLKRIIADFQKANFKIEKSYRVFVNPGNRFFHRFFILNKRWT